MSDPGEKKSYNNPQIEMIKIDDSDLTMAVGGDGTGLTQRPVSRGGTCDEPTRDCNRTFSGGRYSGC